MKLSSSDFRPPATKMGPIHVRSRRSWGLRSLRHKGPKSSSSTDDTFLASPCGGVGAVMSGGTTVCVCSAVLVSVSLLKQKTAYEIKCQLWSETSGTACRGRFKPIVAPILGKPLENA